MSELNFNSKWMKENFTEEVKLIGKGRNTKVYEFTDPKGNKKKILKIIEKKAQESTSKWSQFTKSLIDRLNQLKDCKTVIPLEAHNIDADAMKAYLVLDRFDTCLNESLQSKNTLDNQEIDNLIRTSLECLSFAHRRKISHRSLTPSNIFINNTGNVYIDWGISLHFIDTDGSMETLSESRLDSAFSAPELANLEKSEEDTFYKSDIYSLGLIIFACLGLEEKKFLDTQNYKNSQDHQQVVEKYIDDYVSKTYPELAPLLRKMCAYSPAERIDVFQALNIFTELRNKVATTQRTLTSGSERNEPGFFQRLFKCCAASNSPTIQRNRMSSYIEIETSLDDHILEREIPKNKLEQLEKMDRYLETTWKFEKKNMVAADVNLRGMKKVDDDAVHHMARLFGEQKFIQTFLIKLWGTKVTDKGMTSVLVALRRMKMMRHLLMMMGGMQITDKTLFKMGFVLKDFKNLTYLALEFTASKITDSGLSEIGKSLASSTKVTHLLIDCEWTSVSDKGVEILADSIKNFKKLSHFLLKLQMTKVSDVGAEHIAKMLSSNTELVRMELYLGDTKVSHKGLDLIAESIKVHKDMNYLNIDLRNTKVNKASVQKLVDAVKNFTSLSITKTEQISDQDRVPVEIEGVFRFLLKPNGFFLDITGTKCSQSDRKNFVTQLASVTSNVSIVMQAENIAVGY